MSSPIATTDGPVCDTPVRGRPEGTGSDPEQHLHQPVLQDRDPTRVPVATEPLQDNRGRHLRVVSEPADDRRLYGSSIDPRPGRSYFGGSDRPNSLATVLRLIPIRSAISVFDTPSRWNNR